LLASSGHPDLNADFNIYIEAEMISERGSTEEYCEAMKKDAKPCGVIEFAAFVHMLGDAIVIQYHTTKVIDNSPEVFRLARESVRSDAVTYHVLHERWCRWKRWALQDISCSVIEFLQSKVFK